MPQLDVYIICNMLYGVIILFIATYMLNISNILIIINLLLRIRKLKLGLDKKYIYKILKESAVKTKLQLYEYIFFIKLKSFIVLKNLFNSEDILDICNSKKIYIKKGKK